MQVSTSSYLNHKAKIVRCNETMKACNAIHSSSTTSSDLASVGTSDGWIH